MAIEKVAAMWTALLAMAAIIGVLAYAGGVKFKASASRSFRATAPTPERCF